MATPILDGSERRRSPRISLEVPLELEWRGGSHHAKTALVNDGGALVLSPIFCPLRAQLTVRNVRTGAQADFSVVWSWVDEGQKGLKCRLGLELQESCPGFWGDEYDAACTTRQRAREAARGAKDDSRTSAS